MYVILGGTGQVGSATARALLDDGQEVTIVTRDGSHGKGLKDAGAKVAVADIRDVDKLRKVFQTGKRAFLLNPPADPSGDTDSEERANVAAIVSALDGSGLEKVVAASTYGAFNGERCGDLTVLHEFEQALKRQSIPAQFFSSRSVNPNGGTSRSRNSGRKAVDVGNRRYRHRTCRRSGSLYCKRRGGCI